MLAVSGTEAPNMKALHSKGLGVVLPVRIELTTSPLPIPLSSICLLLVR